MGPVGHICILMEMSRSLNFGKLNFSPTYGHWNWRARY